MKEHTILCVDDEPNVLRALRRLLRREGYQIVTTTDGREALEVIKREEISLQKVPDLDSVGVVEQAKETAPDMIRIVISSYAPAAKIIDAINQGEIHRFVTKPWDDQELKLIVKEALERYDLIQERRNLIDTIAEQNRELQEMNKRLAQRHEERVQDLTLTQQILVELPVPIIGTDPDGIIAFVNHAAQGLFGWEEYSMFELPIAEALSPELVKFFEDCRKQGSLNARIDFTIEGDPFRIQCQPLESQHGLRGYLLTFHESFQNKGDNQ